MSFGADLVTVVVRESVVARPKTTGTIARMLLLRLDDAQAGGSSSSARRSGAVVYSSARDALVPQGERSSA